MSFKAIYFVFILLVFALFSSFNLKNNVDVSLGFHLFEQVPVFLLSIFSFLIGCVLTLPFFFKSSNKTVKKGKKDKNKDNNENSVNYEKKGEDNASLGFETVELKGEKKSWFQKLIGKKETNEKKDNEA
ncbi:MAG: hypothetical protein CR988_05455 [Treponema sp.]|nr:MAG: hypothetical protein CR988_05455 [Treponema sp.]